jgi:hypothetical protein
MFLWLLSENISRVRLKAILGVGLNPAYPSTPPHIYKTILLEIVLAK